MDVKRAILQGIDSARMYRKDGDSPYHHRHPLWPYWWNAVVAKSDCRDLNETTIQREVLKRLKRK